MSPHPVCRLSVPEPTQRALGGQHWVRLARLAPAWLWKQMLGFPVCCQCPASQARVGARGLSKEQKGEQSPARSLLSAACPSVIRGQGSVTFHHAGLQAAAHCRRSGT